ncbi:hypothetical protein XENORESO_018247 [Xenotaenia resolanae]|uniref:Uncharacterized protein n=1 Tax=Xenotaenia resolanae TaxID=208358 RepID=A0ABV0X2C3_9TELE
MIRPRKPETAECDGERRRRAPGAALGSRGSPRVNAEQRYFITTNRNRQLEPQSCSLVSHAGLGAGRSGRVKQSAGSEISREGGWDSTSKRGLHDGYQDLALCPCLPNQEAWPAKWVDSAEPTAGEGFVLEAHFDAETRLKLHKGTCETSILSPRTERKWVENERKHAWNFYTTFSTHPPCQDLMLFKSYRQ